MSSQFGDEDKHLHSYKIPIWLANNVKEQHLKDTLATATVKLLAWGTS